MIDLHRYPDWEARLAAYLESVRSRSFAWGAHDCCAFTAGAVEAMTGVDPMPEFRGKYSSERGARRALLRHGAGTLAATLDKKFEAVPSSHAQRGDIVMLVVDGAIGVAGAGFAIMVGNDGKRDGLIRIERRDWGAAFAWRVPY